MWTTRNVATTSPVSHMMRDERSLLSEPQHLVAMGRARRLDNHNQIP